MCGDVPTFTVLLLASFIYRREGTDFDFVVQANSAELEVLCHLG